MDFRSISSHLSGRFPFRVLTVDSHTAGEATRLILGCENLVPGATMREKMVNFQNSLDHIRLLLTQEPRGHRDMVAVCVTEPVTPGADFGLLYMDARRYLFLCGHATIGAVTTLIEIGAIPVTGDQVTVKVDTPSGLMTTTAYMDGPKVEAVAIRAVPSFVYGTDQKLNLPGRGVIRVDTVCVGGFFVMVSENEIGLELARQTPRDMIDLGMTVIEEANQQLQVGHPERPEVDTIDVAEFYTEDPAGLQGSGLVVYGEHHLDRSPCGTGTAAKLTLLHHHGLIGPGQTFINAGPLGTTFTGVIKEETKVGPLEAVVVEIKGPAHITGIQEFLLDEKDPFPRGFLI